MSAQKVSIAPKRDPIARPVPLVDGEAHAAWRRQSARGYAKQAILGKGQVWITLNFVPLHAHRDAGQKPEL